MLDSEYGAYGAMTGQPKSKIEFNKSNAFGNRKNTLDIVQLSSTLPSSQVKRNLKIAPQSKNEEVRNLYYEVNDKI